MAPLAGRCLEKSIPCGSWRVSVACDSTGYATKLASSEQSIRDRDSPMRRSMSSTASVPGSIELDAHCPLVGVTLSPR